MAAGTAAVPVLPGSTSRRRVPVRPLLLLGFILILGWIIRILWLDKPAGVFIGDETYYVDAARVILGLPVPPNRPYAGSLPGLDPNTEYPPLGKLLITFGMLLSGDNAFGWRMPGIDCGLLAIVLVYGIVRRVGGSQSLAILSAFLFGVDNLVLVSSRMATPDVFLVAFLLLGVYCYLAQRPTLAGLALAAATLCRVSGGAGIIALFAWEWLRCWRAQGDEDAWSLQQWRPLLVTSVVYAVSLFWLLGVMDSVWSSYKNPLDHLRHIAGHAIPAPEPRGPHGDEAGPWRWLLNEVQQTYLRTDVVPPGASGDQAGHTTIFFRAAMNPYLLFLVPAALASAALAAFRRRDDCAMLVLALLLATFVPYWVLALVAHRFFFLSSFLLSVPALAIAVARLLYTPGIVPLVRWGYVAAMLFGLYSLFPFRAVP